MGDLVWILRGDGQVPLLMPEDLTSICGHWHESGRPGGTALLIFVGYIPMQLAQKIRPGRDTHGRTPPELFEDVQCQVIIFLMPGSVKR